MDSSQKKPKPSLLDKHISYVKNLGDKVEESTQDLIRTREQLRVANLELIKQVELFRSFVPENLSGALAQENFDVGKGHSQEEVYSVFSCDIRGFTSISESVGCTEVFQFLNSFFAVMEPTIRKFSGFVYQYVGDEIMALFNLNEGNFTDNVVQAAVMLQGKVIPEFNQRRKLNGDSPIDIGIGVNTGSVAVGIAGTPERMGACAFGTTVNVTARCESLTKDFNAKIIITDDTYQRLREPDVFSIKSLGTTSIRNLESKVPLYEVSPLEEI